VRLSDSPEKKRDLLLFLVSSQKREKTSSTEPKREGKCRLLAGKLTDQTSLRESRLLSRPKE